jgi:hypothetical protein
MSEGALMDETSVIAVDNESSVSGVLAAETLEAGDNDRLLGIEYRRLKAWSVPSHVQHWIQRFQERDGGDDAVVRDVTQGRCR